MPMTLYGTVRDRQYRQANLPQDNYWQNRLGLILTKTRFYLPSSGTSPISPAFDVAWSETAVADRISMSTSKITSAMTLKTVTTLITAETSLWRQYISAPLQAQTLNSAIKLYARSIMGIGLGVTARLVVKVVSNDGGTVRGTLLSIADYSTGTTFATTLTNKSFADGDPPSSVNALDGDRLVIEIGFNHGAAIGDVSASFGDNSGTDLAEDESTTAANNPWFDMYQAILFQNSPFLTYDPQSWPRGPKHVARQRFQQQIAGAAAEDVGASPTFYLTGQDRIYGGPGQVPDYDWQNVLPRALLNYRRLRDDWQHASDVRLIGLDALPKANLEGNLALPSRGYKRPSPDWVRASDMRLVGQDAFPQQNLDLNLALPPRGYFRSIELRTYLDTFALSVYQPFPAFDWPNPSRGYRRPPQDFQHDSDIQLIGQDALPRYNLDGNLALPPRGYRRLVQDFFHDSDIQLVGQDRIYGGPGQVPTYDFPLPPRGYRRLIPDWVRSSDTILSSVAPAPPFFGSAIELSPRGYSRTSDLRTFTDWLINWTLLSQDAMTQANFDSATVLPPRGYRRLFPDWVRASDIQLIGQDVLPRANLDGNLVLPSRGYRRPSPDWLRASDIQLIGQDALPQTNYDAVFQMPQAYRRLRQDFLHASDVQLIGADVLPRYNTDGNVLLPPRGYRRPSPDLLHATDIILIGADALPQRNHQDVIDLPPFYTIKRRIAEPSTPLGSPDILTTLVPPPTQGPLIINDVAYVLPARGYRRLSTSDLSIARGPMPVYIVVLGANKQLEAYLFVPDSSLGANLWLPDSSFGVESENGPDVILPANSD